MHKRKRIDSQAREAHSTIGRTLRRLMNQAEGGKGIGIIRLAKQAGIGVGSVQAILNDPDHSPSIRVLDRLARYFNLKGVWVLVRGIDFEDDVQQWFTANPLRITPNDEDIRRIVALCERQQTFDGLALALGVARTMNRSEWNDFLAKLEHQAA